ncbi:cytochrome P450 [Sphaerisporangium flaviroseum]|uniref:Cytochrome P450 n=1 Tax=Sphaerisporangium flaviroseum TaxID=509199 RepID=A0ABP7ILX2_9ACTN
MTSFDPYDHALHTDPWPIYQQLRDKAPLYRNDELDFWALSRHADVAAAFRDTDLFSSSHGPTLEQWSPNAHKYASFVAMDPPRHTQMRALVSAGFTPRRVREMEPTIRELAAAHLDTALAGGPTFDFIDFASKVPIDVISTMIGVPPADRPQLRTWSEQVIARGVGDTGIPQTMRQANNALAGYYTDLVITRRANPTDDLTSALIAAEVDGARLQVHDIVPVLMLLGIAGNETTTKLLGNAWCAAWRNPKQRDAAWNGNITGWVEETLRYNSPGQMAARLLTADINLHDLTVPAGSRMLLLIGSANRDPRVFAHPDRFDIGRDTTAAIPFIVGPHFCLGASLARMEARIILEELVRRLTPEFHIDMAAATRAHNPNVYGFATLPTTVTLR